MATPWHRLYIKRTVSFITERISDLFDRKVHRLIEIDESPVRPQLAPNLLPGNEHARLANQKEQQLEWLGLKFQPAVFPPKFPGLDVEFKFTKTEEFPSCSHGQR
jgi:hypothetical protein